MTKSIRIRRVNHMNVVLEDFDASIQHFKDMFGAEFLVDIPSPEWHACLVGFGDVIFEFFIPEQFLLNARYGPHHVGLEYQADVDEVREAMAEHGIRPIREQSNFVHTHPADCFGIAFEFYAGGFHDDELPTMGGTKMSPLEYWRDEHALGMVGLKGYSVVVRDLDGVLQFYQGFLGGEVVYEEDQPKAAAMAIGVRVSDDIVELLAPNGDGPIAAHHYRYGDGIRATRIIVKDLGQVERFYQERDVGLLPGDTVNSLAIPAQANRGIIIEFCE